MWKLGNQTYVEGGKRRGAEGVGHAKKYSKSKNRDGELQMDGDYIHTYVIREIGGILMV